MARAPDWLYNLPPRPSAGASTDLVVLGQGGLAYRGTAADLAGTHTHPAVDIVSGTLVHERGGLEADVSAYSGIIKISGGATSQAVEGTDYYGPGGTDVAVADGGTGRSTGTTAYALVATGTTATGAQQTLAAGATTQILVGAGTAALPVWTTATGTGAPVRAGSPALTGTPTAPTAAANTNTTQIATTAFAKAEADAAEAASQPLDAGLTAIAALAVTDGNVIVGNGTTWVAESDATARASLGAAALAAANTFTATQTFGEYSVTGAGEGMQFNYSPDNTTTVLGISRNQAGALRKNIEFFTPSGQAGTINTNDATTTYNTSSDERLKTFLGELSPEKAIAIIKADPVREFEWKQTGKHAVGWGAQTSYRVSPDLATPPSGDEPGDLWGMDYSRRTPYLWAAVSTLLDEVDALKARITELEAANL